MLPVNGLFGHIQYNNFKTLILIVAFLVLSVGGTVGALQLALHGSGMAPGGKNWEVVRQSIENPVFSSNASSTFSRVGPPASNAAPPPTPKPPSADAPLDLSQIPAINRPGVYFIFASPGEQALWALVPAFVYLIGATWWNSLFIRYATRAKPLPRSAQPELYNMVENIAISVGIPSPAIEIVPDSRLNAYASGLTPGTARLGFTSGLLERLNPREIEAVAAHELMHILNRDSRLMAVTKACVDLVVIGPLRYARNVRNKPVLVLPVLVVLATGAMHPAFYFGMLGLLAASVILAFVCKALVMQTREFVADAGAIELTKSPAALISALRKIAGDQYQAEGNPFAQAMMIFGPTAGWFSTHPTLEARVAALREFGGVAPGEEEARFAAPSTRVETAPSPAGPRVRRVAGLAGFDASMLPPTQDFERRPTARATLSSLASLPNRLSLPDLSAKPTLTEARSSSVWRENPAQAPPEELGDSLFERWILSGRLNRIVGRSTRAANTGRRTLGYVYLGAMLFGVVSAFWPRSFP